MYYLIGNIFLLVFLLCLIYFRPDLRRQALIPALFFLPLGPISESVFFRDYWIYETSFKYLNIFGINFFVEDIIFAFVAVGLMSICYDVFLNKKPINGIRIAYPFFGTIISILQVIIFILISAFTEINSIFVAALVAIIFSTPILILRSDLIWCALGSSIISGIGSFLFYFFILSLPGAAEYLFKVSKLPPYFATLFFDGKPILLTEIIWAVCTTFFFSIIYKFSTGSGYS